MTRSPVHLVVDDIFLCWGNTGVARVWKSILDTWAESGMPAEYEIEVTVLNRSGRLSRPEFTAISFPSRAWDDRYPAADRHLLDRVCDDIRADVFVSSYYTFPLALPSVTVVYDLIPEIFGFDVSDRTWLERKLAISVGETFVAISESTRHDLMTHFPWIRPPQVDVAHPGIDQRVFTRRSDVEIEQFRRALALTRDYIVVPGSRYGTNGYKNGGIVFELVRQYANLGFDIVLVGGEAVSDDEVDACRASGTHLAQVWPSDDELAVCLSGARLVVYPSLYEGFGLPPLEALSVGTPVVTSDSPSLRESAGEWAVTFDGCSIYSLMGALERASDAAWQDTVRFHGPQWAARFTWEPLARRILESAREASSRPAPLNSPRIGSVVREYQFASLALQ